MCTDTTERLICPTEGCNNLCASNGYNKSTGKQYFISTCKSCYYKSRGIDPSGSRRMRQDYLVHKDTKCASCNFVAIHPCQLDVDHIDGNHSNNELSNLQTLCANCHRLKTLLNEDYLTYKEN